MHSRNFYALVAFLFLLFYSGITYADLQCAVKQSCSGNEVAVLNIENDQGGHAELSTQTNYPWHLCCLDTSGSLGNICSGNFLEVLRLSSQTNAHVEIPPGAYPYSVCLSAPSGVTINCNYKSACDPGYIQLASISGSTNAHIGDSIVFNTKICCKTSGWMQPPSVSISHSPKFIGSVYSVALNAQATDETNVAELRIYVNDVLSKTCAGPSQTLLCSHTILENTYQHGAVVSYYAIAVDNDGNTARNPLSGEHSFTVCSLDSVALLSDCNGACDAGKKINITATYHGACPGTTQGSDNYIAYIQADAASFDRQCKIERIRPPDPAIQGFISGMNMTCSSPLNGSDQIICKKQWVIPSIPLACQGETIAAAYASINNQSLPPSGQLFDAIPAGGSFQFSASPMNFFVNASISNNNPNYGDLINATVRCYVTQGTESVNCTEMNSQIDNIKFNDVTMTDLQSHRRFDGINWIVEINTTDYNNGPSGSVRVNVSMTYKPASKTKYNNSATYVVNFPPQISDVGHTPLNPYPNDPVTFDATIIDPEGDSIDAAVYTASETKMCDMAPVGSDRFSCTHVIQAENEYYIIAVDGHGAKNSSEPRYLTPRGERINISVKYPDVESGLVKLVNDNPNYTRSMPIKLSITLQVINTTTGMPMFSCTGDSSISERKCTVNAEGVNIPWNGPESAYVGYVPSNAMECDTENSIAMTASRASPFLTANDIKNIFIDCVPRIVVSPKEKRFALGQTDIEAFDIVVFNPRDQSVYTIDIIPAPNSDFSETWIDCQGCGSPVSINAGDSISVPVKLVIAARAGIYPLKITAAANGETYSDDAVLMIYAESLPEFSAWQLAIMMMIAIAIYSLIARKKNIISC